MSRAGGRAGRAHAAWVVLSLGMLACSGRTEPPPAVRAEPATPAAAPAQAAEPPPGPSPGAGASPSEAPTPAPTEAPARPRSSTVGLARAVVARAATGSGGPGCVADGRPARALAGPVQVGVARDLVAARSSTPAHERVVVLRSTPRGLAPLVTFDAEAGASSAGFAPPSLGAAPDGSVAVAWVDARGHLRLGTAGPDGAGARLLTPTADMADPRFPPAVFVGAAFVLVAYTTTSDPPSVRVVRLRADQAPVELDVTDTSGAGVAPYFVRAADAAVLVHLDPRAALSLAHAVVFDPTGEPSAPESLQPILGLATPVRLVAEPAFGDLQLAYLGVADSNLSGPRLLAAHAASITPRTVVPPSATSRLWVDALAVEGGLLVASLARPDDGALDARVVRVHVVGPETVSPTLELVAPTPRAGVPALGTGASGQPFVAFGGEDGLTVVRMRCGS